MFFRIENKLSLPIDVLKAQVFMKARMNIIGHNITAGEEKLNKFCIKEYKLPLKILCMKLLYKLKFSYNQDNEIIATFIRIEDDKIAKLITYGNEKIEGSKILKVSIR